MYQAKRYSLYFLFGVNLAAIVYFWWIGSGDFITLDLSGFLLAVGRLGGLLAVFFVLLQFLLMGRAVWIEQVFGLDKLAKIHRLNGYFSLLFIVIHPLLLTSSYAIDGKTNFFSQFIEFFFHYPDLNQATFALILFIIIVISSIYISRKHLKYETWHFIHLLTYLAVLFAFGHQLKLGGSLLGNQAFAAYWQFLYIFVFGNLLLFRILKPLYYFYKYRFTVDEVIMESEDTNSVYIQLKNLHSFKAKPGQFIIVRFLCKKFWWQAHPFSLSFIPKNNRIRITIKNLGDFTSMIPQLKNGVPVLIEGPYGTFTIPLHSFETAPKKFLFIAGGVGITPLRSLIEKVAPSSDVILLYNNKNSHNIIFRSELDNLAREHQFSLHYIISDEQDFAGEKGRIDKEKLQRLVKDLSEREIYVCGPQPMMESIKKIMLHEFKVKPAQFHYEQFAL